MYMLMGLINFEDAEVEEPQALFAPAGWNEIKAAFSKNNASSWHWKKLDSGKR